MINIDPKGQHTKMEHITRTCCRSKDLKRKSLALKTCFEDLKSHVPGDRKMRLANDEYVRSGEKASALIVDKGVAIQPLKTLMEGEMMYVHRRSQRRPGSNLSYIVVLRSQTPC